MRHAAGVAQRWLELDATSRPQLSRSVSFALHPIDYIFNTPGIGDLPLITGSQHCQGTVPTNWIEFEKSFGNTGISARERKVSPKV